MEKSNLFLFYGIGSVGKTREYSFHNDNYLKPLHLQHSLSIPLITSITVRAYVSKMNRKNDLFSIYVGKELFLNEENDYYIKKYDLETSEIKRLQQEGFERVCLLNYKKYDFVLVGLQKEDKVVPDYYSLKREMFRLKKLEQVF